MEFSQKLKKILDDQGLTQQKLADISGLTTASISRYINGDREPTWDAVQRIAKALNISTEELRTDK